MVFDLDLILHMEDILVNLQKATHRDLDSIVTGKTQEKELFTPPSIENLCFTIRLLSFYQEGV